jgi:hypothetical protein
VSDDRILDELANVARKDRARSEELERLPPAPATESAPANDDEEAFVRSVLARGDDEALVAAAMGAVASTRKNDVEQRAPTGVPAAPAGVPEIERHEEGEERIEPLPREAPPAKVVRPRAWGGRVVASLGAVAALAAGVLIYVKQADREPPLPDYEALLSGTDAPDRAAPQGGTKVTRGAGLSLVARPKVPVTRTLGGRAFGSCGGPLRPVPARVHIAETGAARVDGTPESLLGQGASGTCTLAIVVAPEGQWIDGVDEARGVTRVVKATFVIED